jgi:acyl-CoA thioester hydrolase
MSLPARNPTVVSNAFEWPIRVYYEDTDAGGMVYHSRYLHFLERARTEWLRALGFEQDALAREPGVLFVVRWMELDYRLPARFNERLLVYTRVTELRRASMVLDQEIRRADEDRQLFKARVRIACIEAAHHRPSPIPEPLSREIQHEL